MTFMRQGLERHPPITGNMSLEGVGVALVTPGFVLPRGGYHKRASFSHASHCLAPCPAMHFFSVSHDFLLWNHIYIYMISGYHLLPCGITKGGPHQSPAAVRITLFTTPARKLNNLLFNTLLSPDILLWQQKSRRAKQACKYPGD